MKDSFPEFPLHFHPPGQRSWHPKEIAQYERATCAMAYVKNRKLAIDVGAYGGSWSYAFAHCFKQVHLFEPQERNYECAKNNLAKFKQVKVHNIALMDTPGTGTMKPGGGKYDYVERGNGPIEIRDLDSYNFKSCSLLKIDAEGADQLVLLGARQLIAAFSPVLIVEEKADFAEERYSMTPVEKYLVSLGYERVWKHKPDAIYVRGR